jgi:hypothetical protein
MTRLHHAYVAVCIACCASLAGAQSSTAPAKTQQEAMAEQGYVRYRGGWRTAQEIELIAPYRTEEN